MKTKQPKTYRQGDLWIEEIDTLPKSLKKKKDNILVHSDSTQHNHSLKSGTVYVDRKENLYMDVPRSTQIVHTIDHKPITIPKGLYKIIRQREITMGDLTQLVID